MCDNLSAPLNGTVSFQADTTATFDFRTTATYACDEGFALSGGDPERTCEEGLTEGMGAWNGSAPNCSGKSRFVVVSMWNHSFSCSHHVCSFECVEWQCKLQCG